MIMTDSNSELFAPFRRKDRFGVVGKDPLGLSDFIIVSLFAVFILPFRIIFACFLLVLCYLSCLLTQWLPQDYQLATIAFLGTKICRICLAVLGIHINWVNKKPHNDAFACGMVSNHVSWMDILLHMSNSFPSFVAAESVQKLSFVGKISQMMGCIYVQRLRKPDTYSGVSGKVKDRMLATSQSQSPYQKILLFPEGTTTNGDFLLKFKRGAFLAGVPVQPVILVYKSNWVSPAWETISGPRHVWLILCTPGATVDFIQLPVYVPNEEEKQNPELFAEHVRDFMVKTSGIPFQKSNATFEDKKNYHKLLQDQCPSNTEVKKD